MYNTKWHCHRKCTICNKYVCPVLKMEQERKRKVIKTLKTRVKRRKVGYEDLRFY